MLGLEQLILAILTGASFGFIAWRIGSSALRLAVFLMALYILQTLSQTIFRVIEGMTSINEIIVVGELRLAFAIAAVGMLWLLNKAKA